MRLESGGLAPWVTGSRLGKGKLVKEFKKDSPQTFQDWLLINHAGIPIASGVYLIRVDIPGIGARVLKAFIAMRQQDLQNL